MTRSIARGAGSITSCAREVVPVSTLASCKAALVAAWKEAMAAAPADWSRAPIESNGILGYVA